MKARSSCGCGDLLAASRMRSATAKLRPEPRPKFKVGDSVAEVDEHGDFTTGLVGTVTRVGLRSPLAGMRSYNVRALFDGRLRGWREHAMKKLLSARGASR